MKSLLSSIFTGFLFMLSGINVAFAQSANMSTPETITRKVIEETVHALTTDRNLVQNKLKIYELVKSKLLPHFDAERITARAVGRDWLSATDEQKKKLQENFADILMLTYSNALVGRKDVVSNLTVTWGRADSDEKKALVRSTINSGSGKFQFDYALRNGKNGWKMDDLVVNNLSVFGAYRDQFASIIKNGGGIDGLIQKLTEDRANMMK